MKMVMAVLVMLAVAASVYAGTNDTPEALAMQFIAAVNAKSKEKQKETIHPRCFADPSPVQKEYLDETLARDLRKTIPDKRTVKVTKLDGSTLPFGDMVVWPLNPTHQLEIEFSTEDSDIHIIRFIAKEKDQWFIVVPMLSDADLKKYEEKKKSQQ